MLGLSSEQLVHNKICVCSFNFVPSIAPQKMWEQTIKKVIFTNNIVCKPYFVLLFSLYVFYLKFDLPDISEGQHGAESTQICIAIIYMWCFVKLANLRIKTSQLDFSTIVVTMPSVY